MTVETRIERPAETTTAVVGGSAKAPDGAEVAGGDRLFTRPFGLVIVGTASAWLAHGVALWAIAPFLIYLGFDPALAGIGLAVVAASALLCRLVVGPGIDRRGSRVPSVVGTSLLVLSGVAYGAAATIAAGDMTTLALAGLGAALQGAGFGAMTTSSLAIVGDVTPPRRRGEAVGYLGASQPIVQGLAATLSFALIDLGGFGVLYAAVAVMAATSVGLFAALRPIAGHAPEELQSPRAGRIDSAIAIPVFACGTISFVGGALVLTTPLLGFAAGIGNPGVFFLASAVSGVLARLATGRLSDRWGRARVAAPGLALLAVSLAALVAGADAGLTAFVITGAAYGIAAAAALPALQALVLDRSPAARRGTSSAAMGVAFDIGFGVGSVATGVVVGVAGAAAGLLAAAIAPLVAAGLVALDPRAADEHG